MRLIRGLHNLRLIDHRCVLTIGNFDGVHLGHHQVLAALRHHAQRLQLPTAVVTFQPSPKEFFAKTTAPARLQATSEKLCALAHQDIDLALVLKFDRRLADMSAHQFVEQILVQGLGARLVLIGEDFRFGKTRKGDLTFLQQCGKSLGFSVLVADTLQLKGGRVSSTRIRQLLRDGDLTLAAKLLGRPYSMSGRVVYGQGRGRLLGFRTINLPIRQQDCPLHGVYVCEVEIFGRADRVRGVANIGHKPTVGSTRANLEVHLLDFQGNLYGNRVRVQFCARLRDEKKFSGLEQLQQQIQHDVANARSYFAAPA